MNKIVGTPAEPIECRQWNEDDSDSVLRMLGNGWLKRPIWSWQFSTGISGRSSGRPVVAEHDGSIVGFNGLMPVRIQTEAGVIGAAWSCDFIVDQRYRRLGVGRKLKKTLDDQSELIMAKGTSKAAARVLPRCGWIEGRGPVQLVLFQRPNRLRMRFMRLFQGLRRWWRGSVADGSTDWQFEWRDKLPQRNLLDDLWERSRANYRRVVVRDSEYLNWRYAQLPGGRYEFLLIQQSEKIRALLVGRRDSGDFRIVDYVGPAIDGSLKRELVRLVLARYSDVARISIVTTDPEFQGIFRLLGGWLTRGGEAGFFVRDVRGVLDQPGTDWFLMDGDSDGEILAMAREAAPEISVTEISEDNFGDYAADWEMLQDRGGYDGLFMSWHWQMAWWRHFGRPNRVRSSFMKAATSDGQVVGIVPLIEWIAQARRHWPTRRMQLIGHFFGGPAAMRTEYLDLLIDPDWEEPVCHKLIEGILDRPEWAEFLIQDAPADSKSIQRLVSGLGQACYVRELTERELDECRFVATARSFEEYLATLSSAMRRSLFHGRKRLRALGELDHRYIGPDEVRAGLDLLNELHSIRWGRPVFSAERLAFHVEIAAEAARSDRLRISVLELDGRPISILYDLVAGSRRYNLQQGFDSELADFKGSLGLIHFGYAIEECCRDPAIRAYDLLAGGGQRELYKTRMGTDATALRSAQLVRGRLRQIMYRLYDLVRGRGQ